MTLLGCEGRVGHGKGMYRRSSTAINPPTIATNMMTKANSSTSIGHE
jgi:hypothetical protein